LSQNFLVNGAIDVEVDQDGPLQILAPTIDGHEQFIKMPGVAKAALALAKAARVKDAEAASPLPDGLVRHSDAAPATPGPAGTGLGATRPRPPGSSGTHRRPRRAIWYRTAVG
jgi:hypothetical protein